MTKVNLGCETNVIPGWLNFDPRSDLAEGIVKWQWNEPIPLVDSSVYLCVVQHVLMYCSEEDYDRNFQEIRRVLKPGGVFLLKEDDNRRHCWLPVGTNHKTGHILSSTNPDLIVPVLARSLGALFRTPGNW